jgi:hypothetical protein
MAVIVLALVLAGTVLAVVILIAVIVGIHSEAPYQMSTHPQGLLSAIVRRLLGVYVGKPADTDTANDDREDCLTGNGNSTNWWDNGRWGE